MKNEVKIGIMVAASIIFLILGFNILRGRGMFSNEDQYFAYYDNVAGLSKSAAVNFEGVQIGKVIDIALQKDNRIKVTIGLTNKEFKIPAGSSVQMVTDNMLAGSKVLYLLTTKNTNYLKPGDTLQTAAAAGMIEKIGRGLDQGLGKVSGAVGSLDTLIDQINLVVGERNRQHLDASFQSLDATLAELSKLSKALNTQTAALSAVMNNLNSVTGNLAKNNSQVSAILTNAEVATNKISQSKIQESFDNIEAATKSIQNTLQQLESNNGSLGLLIRDPKLYNSLNRTLNSLDTVMTDLKKRPSRYINVSVFGRKAAD